MSLVEIYTVSCHALDDHGLGSARSLDRRMELAASMLDSVTDECPALVLFPAGFFRAATVPRRDIVANEMLDLSKRSGVAVLFGVDVQPDGGWKNFPSPPECFAYAADAGRKLLWPTARVVGTHGRLPNERRFFIAGLNVGLFIESELFSPRLRASLKERDLTVVLSHGGVTERWRHALAALEQSGPTLVVAQRTRARTQLDLLAPRGWRRQVAAAAPEVTIHRFTPEECRSKSA